MAAQPRVKIVVRSVEQSIEFVEGAFAKRIQMCGGKSAKDEIKLLGAPMSASKQ